MTVQVSKSHISVEDRISFFQNQHEQFLSESLRGFNTNVNFVSNSGEVVSAHHAIIFPRTSYLQTLAVSSESCGSAQDVPTIILADWDHKVVQALVNLLYSGSAVVPFREKNELIRLLRDLRIDISEDNLVTDPLTQSSDESGLDQVTFSETLSPAPTIQTSDSDEGNRIQEKNNGIKINKLDSIKIEEVRTEQETVIEQLNHVLNLLQNVKIENEHFFMQVQKPIGDLLSSLKFFPMETSIDVLPTEIKTDILKYLCDSGALVAGTVCQEWGEILNDRLAKLKCVNIQNHCSNLYSCEEGKCFMPQEMLLAPKILNLDAELVLNSPIPNVDGKVIAKALTNAFTFTINSHNQNVPVLNPNQIQDLFDTLGEKSEFLNNTIYFNGVNMTHLDQNKLIKLLLNIKVLALCQHVGEPQLDVEKFVQIILESSTEFNLQELALYNLDYPENLSVDLADALCKIKTIILSPKFPLTLVSTQRLVENILTRNIRLEKLVLYKQVDWQNLISPEDLKILLSKLVRIALRGRFTPQQLEATRLIPGVRVDEGVHVSRISKH